MVTVGNYLFKLLNGRELCTEKGFCKFSSLFKTKCCTSKGDEERQTSYFYGKFHYGGLGTYSSGLFQIKRLYRPWNQWADFLSILVAFSGRCD